MLLSKVMCLLFLLATCKGLICSFSTELVELLWAVISKNIHHLSLWSTPKGSGQKQPTRRGFCQQQQQTMSWKVLNYLIKRSGAAESGDLSLSGFFTPFTLHKGTRPIVNTETRAAAAWSIHLEMDGVRYAHSRCEIGLLNAPCHSPLRQSPSLTQY